VFDSVIGIKSHNVGALQGDAQEKDSSQKSTPYFGVE
jgi:hypothetical protein